MKGLKVVKQRKKPEVKPSKVTVEKEMTVSQAKKVMEKFEENFPVVKKYKEQQYKFVGTGCTTKLLEVRNESDIQSIVPKGRMVSVYCCSSNYKIVMGDGRVFYTVQNPLA